jgi:hypothetical protein
VPKDSIRIEALLSFLETTTSYRIYADIDSSFTVFIQANDVTPIQLLKNTLAGSPYKVSLYNNNLFILKGEELETKLSPLLTKSRQQDTSIENSIQTEKLEKTDFANSENLIYSVGDPYLKDIPNEITLKGKVIDSKTKEPLIGINLVLKDPFTSATTDNNGNYSIKLPSGRVQLDIHGFNIKESRRQLMLYDNGTFNIEMIEGIRELDAITIIAQRTDNIKSVRLGTEKIQIAKIKNIPTVLGEADILRVIQSLPGVKTVGEASTGYNVRGGATDQNLLLLNDGTI